MAMESGPDDCPLPMIKKSVVTLYWRSVKLTQDWIFGIRKNPLSQTRRSGWEVSKLKHSIWEDYEQNGMYDFPY